VTPDSGSPPDSRPPESGPQSSRPQSSRPQSRRPSKLLDARHWELLWLLGAASFFTGYDTGIVTVALPQVRASYHISQSTASLWAALLPLGALPAVLLARRADRAGRRRLLLITICGFTIATFCTGLAPDIGAFAVCQMVAGFLLGVEGVLAWTVIAEELPSGARGFGFGWLATLTALGTGWSAILFAVVLSPAGISWRVLYLAAVPVLVPLALLRRRLPETRRFVAASEAGRLAPRWSALLRPPHRSRLALICVAAVLVNLNAQAAVFVVDYMQTQRHLSPTAANLILLGAGALAIPVLILAGSFSDRYGRKPVCCGFLVVGVAGMVCFFALARSPIALFGALFLTYVGQFGAWPTGTGFSAELFPTALRALGGSAAAVFAAVGSSASFLLAGLLIRAAGLSHAVVVLALGPLAAAVLIAVGFPETGGRELEVIAADLAAPLEAAELAGPGAAEP
jgi:MFS family permease